MLIPALSTSKWPSLIHDSALLSPTVPFWTGQWNHHQLRRLKVCQSVQFYSVVADLMAYLLLLNHSIGNTIFMGSGLRSETTSAAEFKGKQIMHDSFSMRPFFGYNFGNYVRHWLDIGAKAKKQGFQLPPIYMVNWFRKDPDSGAFLWPGFGENIHVLDWIMKRLDDKEKTPAIDSICGSVHISSSVQLLWSANASWTLWIWSTGWPRSLGFWDSTRWIRWSSRGACAISQANVTSSRLTVLSIWTKLSNVRIWFPSWRMPSVTTWTSWWATSRAGRQSFRRWLNAGPIRVHLRRSRSNVILQSCEVNFELTLVPHTMYYLMSKKNFLLLSIQREFSTSCSNFLNDYVRRMYWLADWTILWIIRTFQPMAEI